MLFINLLVAFLAFYESYKSYVELDYNVSLFLLFIGQISIGKATYFL